ncbi:hypothetical protein LR48_Vigan48s000700 [Vigna angularis]|uniref:Putative plant transposon protein domain-containing protein n=1 Tax=Phaseolus angularis TaxID=3914 RepID=A0A0L9T4P9_PHAAN|nr:hypothetical protein LR48_Vigan48s000700 [Vigna angularis]
MDFWKACEQLKNQSPQQWQHRPSLSRRRITLEEAVQHYIQIPNCHHKSTQAVEEFDRPSPQQWQQQPFLPESLDSLDDALQRFLKNSDATQKSIEESCKGMEMHLCYISQRLNVKVNTEVNPKEEGQAIVIESDKIFYEKKIGGDEEKIERKEKEELSEKDKDEEKEKEVVEREERKKICVKIKKLKRKRKGKKKKMRGKKKKSYEKSHPRMASSSGKRIKTVGSKRKDKEPEHSYANKEQLENKNWGRLATYPAPANITVLKEFYTNAGRLGDHPAKDYLSYVRGHAIRYDPDSINRFFNTEWGDARMQFIHKGQVATTQMIIGMYDTPPTHRWTMDEFHNVVAWPEEQAQDNRAGAAEASAMDDEDDEDAFEDAKDDEDTNDNMG